VLDNCEHLLAACDQLVEEFAGCPNIRILATSREPLGVAGETLCPVLPLAVPVPSLLVGEISQIDSVRLFVERAQSVLPSFGLTPDNAGVVAAICRDLDGIPLAIAPCGRSSTGAMTCYPPRNDSCCSASRLLPLWLPRRDWPLRALAALNPHVSAKSTSTSVNADHPSERSDTNVNIDPLK